MFYFMQNCENDPLCRRLRLQDIISSSYQRLTKYPLLLEGIQKNTPSTWVGDALPTVAATVKSIVITSTINKNIRGVNPVLKLFPDLLMPLKGSGWFVFLSLKRQRFQLTNTSSRRVSKLIQLYCISDTHPKADLGQITLNNTFPFSAICCQAF